MSSEKRRTDDHGYRIDYWTAQAAEVAATYADPEIGHAGEDALLIEFVEAVADGLVNDPQAAAQALRKGLLMIEREKWFA